MTGIRFENIGMLHLMWGILLIIGLFWYAGRKRREALLRLIEASLVQKVGVSAAYSRRRWKAAAIVIAMIFIIVAAARPAWNPKPETVNRRGRDVVFILDVSKSMLAEDLKPNRLMRAKLAISDCIDVLEGDRVALVVFAGTSVVKCPLTQDYGFFRMMLDRINTDSASRGGTMIGDSIRTALDEVFDDQVKAYKDIVLITDGEDHDSFPVEAAKKAGQRGVRIIAIGLGDENEGRRIPITDENGNKTFLKYKGKEVWTKLDANTLRKMANATPGGRYLNVATGAIDLGGVYLKLIANAEKKNLTSETIKRYEEKFQIFLTIAIFLLLWEMVVGDRKKRKKSNAA
ncbi:MAG: VWA domain-containing protein [Deltaproteobacteria bacterium]|nr:VWA domain-containing protein [Deltaproteobacteria bacterium]